MCGRLQAWLKASLFLATVALPAYTSQATEDPAPATDDALMELNMATFRETVEAHQLSYVFFYTKRGPDWETSLQVFKEAAVLIRDKLKSSDVICGTVDLDENSPLTLYTKYNSVDLMIFYPDFVATPLRFHGPYTPAGILESAAKYQQYTYVNLRRWADPSQLTQDFMTAKFKSNASDPRVQLDLSKAVSLATFQAKKLNIYGEYLDLVKGDMANLVEVSNNLRFQLHNAKNLEKKDAETGEFKNEATFLDNKMRLNFADDLLQYMFPNKKLPKFAQIASDFLKQKEQDRREQMIIDAQAKVQAAASVGELM